MNKKISLVTCGLLLSTSMAFGADSIDEAFKSGSVSGDITLYGVTTDNKGGTANTDDSYATTGLAYETASYMGLSAKSGFRAGHAFGSSTLANDALMTEAYIKYATEGFFLSVGRQAIDLEWLGDYNESVVAGITAIPDTTIVLGYVNQQAAADEDEIGDFSEITEDGAYVIDAKYTGLTNVELNPYFYSAPDVADFYGLKATYSADMFGVVAQYAASSEDTGSDGSIGHIEANTSISGISAALGYIKTDKTAGVASISAYGDNISPFDNGVNTYSADAKTVYGSLGYSIAGVDLGLLYGETDYAVNSEEKELNLTAGYSITDSLGLSLLYVKYDEEGSSINDSDYASATLAYSF
ncbi:MAG: hypothetical protein CL623_11395 [Arcobacter sp.]|nr:hypothetical protein [Arcobacter sp.]|tara:strand:- start:696 stop:1760 length:1065 start_codon:yes stop_codon:yes gene_type:complete